MRPAQLLFAGALCLAWSVSSAFLLPSSSSFSTLAPAGRRTAAAAGPLRVVITPDGSPSMQEYRKKVLEDLVKKKSDAELDGYQLFDMIVAKWGVPYGVELRRLDFAGKKYMHVNVMWKYLGQQSFPLTERQYLEHLEFIARKLIQWGQVKEFKQNLAECRKKPQAYFGYAIDQFVEDVRLSKDDDE